MSLSHSLVINVPFETEKQATIARNSLSPDPILKQTELTSEYAVQESQLICTFRGVSDRVLRVAVSNVIDNIKTIVECMDEFEGQENTIFQE